MRIIPQPLARYPWYLRLIFRYQRRRYGAVLEASLLWGRAPRLFVAVAWLHRSIDRRASPIEPALRALTAARVAQVNHCPYCADLNVATLLARGVSIEKTEALERWADSALFSERERAALEYAETISHTAWRVGDAMMARLKRHFDDEAIVELTALIAFQNLSSKFNRALDVPSQGLCAAFRPPTRDGTAAPTRSASLATPVQR